MTISVMRRRTDHRTYENNINAMSDNEVDNIARDIVIKDCGSGHSSTNNNK